MNARDRKKLEAVAEVVQFGDANPVTDNPGFTAALEALRALLLASHDMGQAQESGYRQVRAATNSKANGRRRIRRQFRVLRGMVEAAALAVPELALLYSTPSEKLTHVRFVDVGRQVVQALRGHEAALTGAGMRAGYLDNLARELDGYEAAVSEGRVAVQTHHGASEHLEALAARSMVLIHQLDSIYQQELAGDTQRLAAWRVARDIPWPKRSKKGKSKGEAA